jgi:hypothetical protein
LKELASKPVEVPKAEPPSPPPVATVGGTDLETTKALKAMGLEVQRGKWSIASGDVLKCENDPDPANTSPTLMSLRRAISKNFKKITLEIRGGGDSAGFSFKGEGRRFVVKPSTAWQTISLTREGAKVVFKLENKVVESLEKIAADVTAENIAADGTVFFRFVGPQGELRNIKVED